MFNDLTIKQASEIDDFIPDRETILEYEESGFVTHYTEQTISEYGEIYSSDLQCIINTWELEESAFKDSIEVENTSLVDSIKEWNDKIIDFTQFEEFLDELEINCFHNRAEISSNYSSHNEICYLFETLSEAVDGYIKELVKRYDIIFTDFEVGDEFYWCSLSEKFGYPPDDDVNNDDDGDDGDGGDQEENVPVPV